MRDDLGGALAVAVQAAREAGALLRAEFHRPGGPRGHGRHAEVDIEAERLIRSRLLQAYPQWGYRGEETGSAIGDPPPAFVWLVDPNDGTSNYLKGSRGPAVSIALLRDREPILGVVYSPCAPDDGGDLIAWAEGQGSITRNGQPFQRPPWQGRLGPQDCVLVSEDANNLPRANLRCVAPGRYRAVPSIAYRLALAATGDAAMGTSLHGAGDWDYAAGQALLRAVGGDLYDQEGAPIAYTARGESRSRRCFGGDPAIVPLLLDRPWREVSARPEVDPSVPPFLQRATLLPGSAVADHALLQRAHGCLLGQLAGDALGSLVEFQSADAIRQRYSDGLRDLADGGTWQTIAGQPTDDSELALALARTVVSQGRYDPETAARAYGYWYRSGPFDVGATTARALSAIASPNPQPPEPSGGGRAAEQAMRAASRDSQANGSLMRASPLGIWGHGMDPDRLAEAARSDSQLTHPHPVCQEACAVFVVAIGHAMAAGAPPREVYELALDWARRRARASEIADALAAAAAGPPADYLRNQGWVLIALQNAFYQLLHASTAEQGIIATAMAGGDTDTNAAIAGALLGAVHGRDSLRPSWVHLILSCRPVAGAAGIARPRPYPFWPVDALELGERLLLADAPGESR